MLLGSMGAGIFGIMCVLFFWWAVIVGFRTLFRRFVATLFGNDQPDEWTFGRRGLGGIDTYDLDDLRPARTYRQPEPEPDPLHSVTRQMETTLAETRETAAELDERIAAWRRSLDTLEVAIIDWSNRAQTAVDAGREDLARMAIAERQRAAGKAAEIRADLAEIERLQANYVRDIEALESKLAGTWRREAVIQSRMDVAQTSLRARELVYGERTKDALARLEVMEHEALLAEGRAAAMTLGAGHSLDDQFASLQREASTDAEVARRRGFGRKKTA